MSKNVRLKLRFSEAHTLEFVKLYGQHECLWNQSLPQYLDRNERSKAYNQMIADFYASTNRDLSVSELKVKIKNLRTTYIQQVKQIFEKSTPQCLYEPSLVWFNEMDSYLKNIATTRASIPYLAEDSEVDSSVALPKMEIPESSTHYDPLDGQSEDDTHYVKQESDQSTDREFKQITTSHRSKKKRLKHSLNAKTVPVELEPLEKNVTTEDEFDIYGKYIACQLRRMELQKALKLQLTIQSLISEARIGND